MQEYNIKIRQLDHSLDSDTVEIRPKFISQEAKQVIYSISIFNEILFKGIKQDGINFYCSIMPLN